VDTLVNWLSKLDKHIELVFLILLDIEAISEKGLFIKGKQALRSKRAQEKSPV